jgi:phosphoribosylanthranilate isomerase
VSHPEVLVKICGLTCVEDALACAELGADWIGLNFHPASPRYVDPDVASAIVEALPRRVTVVGVFVDRPVAEVAELADRVGLGTLQLHGHEPPEDLAALGRFRVVRAFRLCPAGGWAIISEYLARAEALGHPPDSVLVDAYVPGLSGGTGTTIDPSLLDDRPALPRLILAGGLTPENVAQRIARGRPWMVDVASGVESAPGRKDRASVAAFIRAVRPGVGSR